MFDRRQTFDSFPGAERSRQGQHRQRAGGGTLSKTIVLLSDGTGQHGGVGYETNVWRLYGALVHDDRQLCCYDDGVNSQDLRPVRAAAGA